MNRVEGHYLKIENRSEHSTEGPGGIAALLKRLQHTLEVNPRPRRIPPGFDTPELLEPP